MMARVVIRKPEIPCFVLNSQVRVADWEQVCGTHQGQRQTSTPRSKAGHRTVLTNRVINAFYPCNADAIHTGQSSLMREQRNLLCQIEKQAVQVLDVQLSFLEMAIYRAPFLPLTAAVFEASQCRAKGRTPSCDRACCVRAKQNRAVKSNWSR